MSSAIGIGASSSRRRVPLAGIGLGAEFGATLPLANQSPAQEPDSAHLEQRGAGRVLVVDDNADSADGMAMLLEHYGYESRAAYSYGSGRLAIEEFDPDAVLLDLSTPEPDGYRLAALIRNRERRNDIPLIAMTGYGQERDFERSQQSGMQVHLVKPIDGELLHRHLLELLGR